MRKQYSQKQIQEAIDYWKSVLNRIDEAEDSLLKAIFKTFNTNDLLKPFTGKITDVILSECFTILTQYFFTTGIMPKIPIIYDTEVKIKELLLSRNMTVEDIPSVFYGTYSTLYDNDPLTLKWTDDLKLHDDIILLNSDYIDNRSISFLISCLCHEMIHYYDRLFGEFCDFTKFTIITKIKKDKHNTMTFETMKEKANNMGINVIQQIPKNKDAEILDKEGIELLFVKAQAEGIIVEDESRIQNNIDGITFNKDRTGGSINIF